MTLAFGMQLPIQAQSTVFVEDWEKAAGADELRRVARACDAAGFAYVAVCDHVAIPRSRADAMSTTWYDTIATLGWLAGVTRRVGLLSHVYVAAYRHPLQTAKAFATLDALSDGRAILGVGAGHVEEEFDALGVSFAERGKLTDEAIDEVRIALADEWGGGGDLGQRPRPIQAGGPPIWVGGSSPAAMRRAALRGDGWLPQGPPKEGMKSAIARIRQLRADAGRSGPFTIGAFGPPGPPEKVAASIPYFEDLAVDQVQVRFPSISCDDLIDQIERFSALVTQPG